MRLRDYFNGYRLTLRSPLPAREIEDRINAGVVSRDNPLRSGIIGEAGFGMFELRLRQSLWTSHRNKPRLAGRIFEESAGSRIEIYFGASVMIYAFYFIWFAVMAWLGANLASRWWTLSMSPGDPMLVFLLPWLLIAPIYFHYRNTARSDQEFEELMDFISSAAEARVDRRRMPGRGIFGPTVF